MTSWVLPVVLQRRFSLESSSSPRYWLDCPRSWKFHTWIAEASALQSIGKQVRGKALMGKQKNPNFTEVTQFFITTDERVMNVLPLYRRLNSTLSLTHTRLIAIKSVRQAWSKKNSPAKREECWVIKGEHCLNGSGGRSCSLPMFQSESIHPTDSIASSSLKTEWKHSGKLRMITAVNYAAFTAPRKTQSGVRYGRPLEISISTWWMSSRECQTFQTPSISSSMSTPPARSHTKESSCFLVPFNRPRSHYRWKWDFPDVGSFHYC